MPQNSVRFAVTMPKQNFALLEEMRKKQEKTRSSLINEAFERWLKDFKRRQLIKRYVKGYMTQPEDVSEVLARQKVGLESFSKEEW